MQPLNHGEDYPQVLNALRLRPAARLRLPMLWRMIPDHEASSSAASTPRSQRSWRYRLPIKAPADPPAATAISQCGRAAGICPHLETILLSLTVFLLMVPTVNEILTRVPDGNPIAKGPDSPILLGALGALVVMLIGGLTAQMLHLRRRGREASALSR